MRDTILLKLEYKISSSSCYSFLDILIWIISSYGICHTPNAWSPIFNKNIDIQYIDIEPLDIRTKFEQSNCSGVLDMQILIFTSYGRCYGYFC